jgi:hypothetical protein
VSDEPNFAGFKVLTNNLQTCKDGSWTSWQQNPNSRPVETLTLIQTKTFPLRVISAEKNIPTRTYPIHYCLQYSNLLVFSVVTRCGHHFCSACAIKRFAKTPKCIACGAPTSGIFNRADKVIKKLKDKRDAKEAEKGSDEEGDAPKPKISLGDSDDEGQSD